MTLLSAGTNRSKLATTSSSDRCDGSLNRSGGMELSFVQPPHGTRQRKSFARISTPEWQDLAIDIGQKTVALSKASN
jgi:hypothetical protein